MLGSLRAAIGGNSSPIIGTTQTITATSTIAIQPSVAFQTVRVSAATPITLTSNPQIATGIEGQEVTVFNAGANTITFFDGNSLGLNGTLALGSTQFATFEFLNGFWQLSTTNGSPVWTPFVFQNGFGNIAGFQNCEYTKWLGFVKLRGHATRTGAASSGTAIQISALPLGFRSSNTQRFATEEATPGFGVSVTVQTGSGGGLLYLGVASTMPGTQFVAFNGIEFRT